MWFADALTHVGARGSPKPTLSSSMALQIIYYLFIYLFWSMVSHGTWSLSFCLPGWPVNLWVPLVPVPSTGTADALWVGDTYQNSGSHTCVASALPTEPLSPGS